MYVYSCNFLYTDTYTGPILGSALTMSSSSDSSDSSESEEEKKKSLSSKMKWAVIA